jgi:ADP-ribose pyrophosphatase
MTDPQDVEVRDIEVIEDFTSTARCDEGWLHVRRLRVRNRRADGSVSPVYRVDMVDRPRLDAVAVTVYRREGGRVEVLTRQQLRPAAYFRKDRAKTIEDGQVHLFIEEVVAGLLEPEDLGEEGIRRRAALEVKEEAGFDVSPGEIRMAGGPWLPGSSRRRCSPARWR